MAAITAGVVVAGAAAYSANRQSAAAKKAARAQTHGIDEAQRITQENIDRALPALDQGFTDAQGTITDGTNRARQALLGGLDPTLNELTRGFTQAQNTLSPSAQRGESASQLQAALSGALGPVAQQQAMGQFQESPGQQFLRQQQEQALLRNEAALGGGLGQSGRVMEALQEQAAGRAALDFDNQFSRLGQIAQRGDAATANIAQLQATLGQARSGIRGGLAQALAGMDLDTASQLAQLQQQHGTTQANTLINQGTQLSQLAQNRGAALAGADVFQSQQTPALVQGLQAGLGAYGAAGGTFGGNAPSAQSPYSGPEFDAWIQSQRG